METTSASGAATPVWLCATVPLLASDILLAAGKRVGSRDRRLAVGASGLSLPVGSAALIQLIGASSERRAVRVRLYRWFATGDFVADLSLRVDPLSVTSFMLVTSIETLIHVCSVGYMEHDLAKIRFFAYLNLLVASVLLPIPGDSYVMMFVGWGGVGLVSYLLISLWNQVPTYATAGKKAFAINHVGDMGLLVAMMFMISSPGTVTSDGVTADATKARPDILLVVGVLLLVGACGKSTQFPLQVWLGDAMVGPTPIPALIHTTTIVVAGVYLMVRSSFVYDANDSAQLAAVVIGTVTLVFGTIVGSIKDDMEKILATSTMSQISCMILVTTPSPADAAFAVFHLVTHSFSKTNMLLGVGSIIHAMDGEVDMRRLDGLHKRLPVAWAAFLAGYLAIIGSLSLPGYFPKDKIIEAAFVGGGWRSWVLGGPTMAVAGLTALYTSRLFFMVFRGEKRSASEGAEVKHPREAPATMCAPQILLAMGSTGLGLVLNAAGFVEWLEPVVGPIVYGEPILPVSAITFGTFILIAAGVGAAWKVYVVSPVPAQAPEGNALVCAARVDLYQDVFNKNVFMRLGMALMSAVVATDVRVVDGAVEGVAKGTPAVGRLSTRLQNGYTRTCASYMTLGVVIVLVVALAARL